MLRMPTPSPFTHTPQRATAGKVAEIHEALKKGDGAAREAIQLLRDLIDHIVVTPTQRPEPVGLQVVGNLAALLVDAPIGVGALKSVVAGVGFEPTTFRL